MTLHTHQRFMAKAHDREPYKADCPACEEKTNTHTPGPWAISNPPTVRQMVRWWVYSESTNQRIANMFVGTNSAREAIEANAALIAAAPELLEALKRVTHWIAYPQTTVMAEEFDFVFKAIAKAEGRGER